MAADSKIKPTEHRVFPIISGTMVFPDKSPGPKLAPLTVMATLTPSQRYPRARITLASILGTTGMTVHQAAMLRDQLDLAIAAVVEACPEMSAPDETPLPKEIARG